MALFGPETRRNAYRRASEKLGVHPIITLRDLRRTLASLPLANGAALKALMAAMGHKTMAAADLHQSTTDARAADFAHVAAQSLGLKVEHKGAAPRPGRNLGTKKPNRIKNLISKRP